MLLFFHSFLQFGKWLDDIHHRAILSGVLWRAELHSIANNDNIRIWYAYDQLWGTLHRIAHEERIHLRQDSDVRCWPHRRLAKSRFWHWSWRDNASGSEQHESTGNTRPSTQKKKVVINPPRILTLPTRMWCIAIFTSYSRFLTHSHVIPSFQLTILPPRFRSSWAKSALTQA